MDRKPVTKLEEFLTDGSWTTQVNEDLSFVSTREYRCGKRCMNLEVKGGKTAYGVEDPVVTVGFNGMSDMVLQITPDADCAALDYACHKWAALLDALYEKFEGVSIQEIEGDGVRIEVVACNHLPALGPDAEARVAFVCDFFAPSDIVSSHGGVTGVGPVIPSYDAHKRD